MTKRKTDRTEAAELPGFARGLPITPELEARWRESRERRQLAGSLIGMRRAAGLSQKELAALMEKDQAFISRMESITTPPPKAQHIALYAKHCGYMTAYAFFARPQNEAAALHTLCAVGQAPDEMELIEGLQEPLREASLAKTARRKGTAPKARATNVLHKPARPKAARTKATRARTAARPLAAAVEDA